MLRLLSSRTLLRTNTNGVQRAFLSTERVHSLAAEVDGPVTTDKIFSEEGHAALIDNYRKTHQIHLKGRGLQEYKPLMTFNDVGFHKSIHHVIKQENYTEPTPIQAQSWPLAMNGRDMISVARTGSGKTCAFLLPAIHKLLQASAEAAAMGAPAGEAEGDGNRRRRRRKTIFQPPKVLVLAPTRELCVQIGEEALKYGNACGIKSAILYGGASKGPQIKDIERGAEVIIATPGRCNDLIQMGYLDVTQIQYLVLDEADRMLDMGFEPQINEIVDKLPAGPERQTLFFSATWPKEVQSMAQEYLTNPVLIQVGSQGVLNANKAIVQKFDVMMESEKEDALLDTIESFGTSPTSIPKMIIFRSRKSDCEDLVSLLRKQGYAAAALHGDKTQNDRNRIMDMYRVGKVKILVATDVASRGLDIKDIEVVINYDFPNDLEDYVHRIGRTGRADRVGTAVSFMTIGDKGRASGLLDLLSRSEQEIPTDLRKLLDKPPRLPPKPKFRQAGQPRTANRFKADYDDRSSNRSFGSAFRPGSGAGYQQQQGGRRRDDRDRSDEQFDEDFNDGAMRGGSKRHSSSFSAPRRERWEDDDRSSFRSGRGRSVRRDRSDFD